MKKPFCNFHFLFASCWVEIFGESNVSIRNQDPLSAAATLGEELGFPVYVVGGPVRDLLLAKRDRCGERTLPLSCSFDLDLNVEGDGILFAKKLADRLGGETRIHKRFQTANVRLPSGFKIDVATARKERYPHPAASPQVERGSIREDLLRRDFSMNALAIRLNGEEACRLVDVSGGQEDLKKGIIRVLHDRSFIDDPSRILRAVRFEQRFGFILESYTFALMERGIQEGLVKLLSGPKLFQELTLILKEKEPLKCIRRLDALDLLKVFYAELFLTPGMIKRFELVRDSLAWYGRSCPAKKAEGWLVYLMALLEDIVRQVTLKKKGLQEVCKQLVLPVAYVKILKETAKAEIDFHELFREETPSLGYMGRILHSYSLEVLLFLRAKTLESKLKDLLSHYLVELIEVEPVLRGEDLVGLGLKPGPCFKEVIEKTRELKIDGILRTREDEIQFVREHYLRGDQ